jgi:hypothetical protein
VIALSWTTAMLLPNGAVDATAIVGQRVIWGLRFS